MLAKSLQEVGAARSIVIDENGRILAGNGTVQAAGEVGIERVQVVDADGETIVAVRRTGLTEAQKRRLALLDNRTAELAEWDKDVLEEIFRTTPEQLEGLWSEPEIGEMFEVPATMTTIPLVFLPEQVEELEAEWPMIEAMYENASEWWLARMKDYDRIMNASDKAGTGKKNTKYLGRAILDGLKALTRDRTV